MKRLLFGVALLLPACGVPAITTSSPPRVSTESLVVASGPVVYPWPECGAIVAWLQKNLDDPDGFEVVEWEKRTEAAPGIVNVNLRYRAKTGRGKVVWTRSFQVRDGSVSYALQPFRAGID